MKKFNFIKGIFAAALLIFTVSDAGAQIQNPPVDQPIQNEERNRRPNLPAELNLTIEQIAGIRRINREKRPATRLAQQRLREANRSLDQAVYNDNYVDADVQARVHDVQAAQAEVIKLRTESELAVRRILTAAQLAKFRELRSRFTENTETRPNRRQNRRSGFPPRNFIRGVRRNSTSSD